MWAYSSLDQDEFIEAIGNGATTNLLRRTGAGQPTPAILDAAADYVGWSREFARKGPAAIDREERSLADRITVIEDELADLTLRVAAVLPAPPGAEDQRHPPNGRNTTPNPRQSAIRAVPDDPSNTER